MVQPTGTQQSLVMMRQWDLFDWPGGGTICLSQRVNQWRTWPRVARGKKNGHGKMAVPTKCTDHRVSARESSGQKNCTTFFSYSHSVGVEFGEKRVLG